jgi:hypothetical protein
LFLRNPRLGPVPGVWLLCAGLLVSCAGPPASGDLEPKALQAVSPRGDATWPPTFSWSGVADDAVVRVRVFDEAERQVFGMEARGTSRVAPGELRTLLEPGRTYLWRVARVDENGEEAGASELTPFSIR